MFPCFSGLVVTQINATMSGGLDVLTLNEEDVTKMLAATTHLGAENVNFQVSLNACIHFIYLLEFYTSFYFTNRDEKRIRSIFLLNVM